MQVHRAVLGHHPVDVAAGSHHARSGLELRHYPRNSPPRSGRRQGDDRLAALQFRAGEAEVEVALEVERGHVGIGRVVEPGLGTVLERLRRGACHGILQLSYIYRQGPAASMASAA